MSDYVVSAREVLWGTLLLGLTMAIHGIGMLMTLRLSDWLKIHTKEPRSTFVGLLIVVLASWVIILTALVEVILWSVFFLLQGAMPTHSAAFYYALVNYTTLDSGYLPQQWRLLEGLLAMAGLLTLAWSTGVLYTLVEEFQRAHLRSGRNVQTSVGGSASAAEPPGRGRA